MSEMSEEIKRCDELEEKREKLHDALRAKVNELLTQAKKRGMGNKHYTSYATKIVLDGEEGVAELKRNDETYMRVRWAERGEIYYVSKFSTPPATVLVEGVKVLKTVISNFNAEAAKEEEAIAHAGKELEAVRV
jgi:hypothetical protein